MNVVEPIRDTEKILQIRKILKLQSLRNELLFLLGINVGLRISDLLKLTWQEVEHMKSVIVTEKKTKKTKKFYISDFVQKLIMEYSESIEHEPLDYVFAGRKGSSHITRQHAYLILSGAFETVGLQHCGTHTLRKTFGYHCYSSGVPLELLMSIFNHSSATQTLRYIGISEDQKKDVYLNLNLGEV